MSSFTPGSDRRTDAAATTERRQLADFLSKDYCARCDTFGHIGPSPFGGFCEVCWDARKPLPSRLRRTIEEVVGVRR